MTINQLNIDLKDLEIIKTFDRKDQSKISTKEISTMLKLPDRSIRYRLAKLRERKILVNKEIITHERKFGLSEFVIITDIESKNRRKLGEIITNNKALTWSVPTIGTFNGLIIHAINSIKATNHPKKLMESLKEKGLVMNYNIFEMVDHHISGWNYDWFDKDCNWTWDWDFWIEKIIEEKPRKHDIEFISKPKREDFDFYDIQILKNLHINSGLSQKEIADTLQISESLVSRKIRMMERNGIIRGYESAFKPFKEHETVICVFNAINSLTETIGFLTYLPFPKTIAYQDESNIALAINLQKKDVVDFLRGIYLLDDKMKSSQTQIWLDTPNSPIYHSYDLYTKGSNAWDSITIEYERTFQKLLK